MAVILAKEEIELLDQIRQLEGKFYFESYYSLSCYNCPDVVQALNLMAVLNPNITHTVINGAMFQDEVQQLNIMAVPAVFLNSKEFGQGRMTLRDIVTKIYVNAEKNAVQKLNQHPAYDVLIVGSGPAGASAAIYAARKGLRTGIIGERFGGQVLGTIDIENYISVSKTEGPKLAAALRGHVNDYVDIIDSQIVAKLIPADTAVQLHKIETLSRATLSSRSSIIATSAKWCDMNVPRKKEYRTKEVTYCSHCDGPLFKGKRVAVIGGGNSGVEATIDLAGIVEHFTLLEFAPEMRADVVLQQKLASLSNVDIILQGESIT